MRKTDCLIYRTEAAALVVAIIALCSCVSNTTAQAPHRRGRAPQQRQLRQASAIYTNPVLAGDYPDPSVIRVGRDYYATATSSEWAPEFPLLHSRDLVNWTVIGAVFDKRPAWSVGNYWAPEIAEDRGRYYIYYTARKKDGPLCVAVATAARPAGPYTDHGSLICQDAGSIDAFPIRDESGKRYLVWKEDGNSRKLPTPIWAQQLSEDGTKLIGELRELMRNDAAWEAQLVEGPYIMRRDGYFYMFYSGNACCGRECNYALGVARSRTLLGPWEKHALNPILKGNEAWKCPGHGSIVDDNRGRSFLMYHAYHPQDSVYVGRQALLDEVVWGADGWPTINDGKGASGRAVAPLRVAERDAEYNFFDDFTSPRLRAGWQWPQANEPMVRVDPARGGRLTLAPTTSVAVDMIGGAIGWWTTLGDYVATTVVDLSRVPANAFAGLGAYGDSENALGIAAGRDKIVQYRREKKNHQVVAETLTPRNANLIQLRMTATGGNRFRFAISSDGGRSYENIGQEMDGSYLPPWDRGVRVALTSGGAAGASGTFELLRITPLQANSSK